MLIDWFTVFAQIVNFLILVALLRWVLYQPILQVMRKRRARIEAELKVAEDLRQEARREADAYRQQQRELQHQKEQLLAEAKAAADRERQAQLAQLRQEIESLRAAWQEDLRQEQDTLLDTLRQQVSQQVMAIARKALADLADVELEQAMVRVFCQHLHELEESQRQAIAASLAQDRAKFDIRSRFVMPDRERQQLAAALQSEFGPISAIEFTTAPDLVCGIEVKLIDRQIIWSLDSYLQALERAVFDTLAREVDVRGS